MNKFTIKRMCFPFSDQIGNFEKQVEELIDDREIEYDYDSIMHYGTEAFTIEPGLKTILPIGDKRRKLGQRDRLSPKDIIELNLLYDCKSESI